MNLVLKILLHPLLMLKLFVNNLLNPSKRVKQLLKQNLSDSDNIALQVSKRLHKLKKIGVLDNDTKVATYHSVFMKLFCLIFLFLITCFGIFFWLRGPDLSHRKQLINGFYSFTKFCRLEQYFYKCKESKGLDIIYIPLLISGIIFSITGILWIISFHWLPIFLKITNHLLSISIGLFLGIFYSMFSVVQTQWDKLFLLFIIPFIITIMMLGMITYLHQIKKQLQITEQTKKLIVNCFILIFFVNIIFIFMSYFYHFFSLHYLIILLFFSIIEFILSALMWAVALNELDLYLQEKIPQKYEWFLVTLMFISFLMMFAAIFKFILGILSFKKSK
jgi:hypothetical protein